MILSTTKLKMVNWHTHVHWDKRHKKKRVKSCDLPSGRKKKAKKYVILTIYRYLHACKHIRHTYTPIYIKQKNIIRHVTMDVKLSKKQSHHSSTFIARLLNRV